MGCLKVAKGEAKLQTPSCKMAFMEKVKDMATRKVLKKNLAYLRSLVACGSVLFVPSALLVMAAAW
eukprot:6992405-Prorocentrum_lima.AAC.1